MEDVSVVVTGAARGIGRAVVRQLSSEGARVVGVDRDEAALASATEPLAPGVVAVAGDIRDWSTHERAADAAEALGPLRGWVNNAGVDIVGAAHEVTAEQLEESIRVLQLGPMYGTAVAVRRMLAGRQGAIVNVGSITGRVAFPGFFAYQAAKAAVEMICRGIAVDYGPFGIRCNAVCPGIVHTAIGRPGVSDAALAAEGLDDPAASPQGRRAAPEEIAEAVAYLLSSRASFVNGASLVVDGGATARCMPYPRRDDIA